MLSITLKNFLIVALTSKTYSEVINLYKLNNIKFPFSTENGSTFFVPKSNNKQDFVFKQIINKNATTSDKIIRKIDSLPINSKKNIVFIKDLSFDKQMKITKLKVNTNNNKYSIIIGSGIINKLSKILNQNSIKFNKSLLIIDSKVPKVLVQKFSAKPYSQIPFKINQSFIPNLSVLDMISYLEKDELINNLKSSNTWGESKGF